MGPIKEFLYKKGELGATRALREFLGVQKLLERASGQPKRVCARFDPLCLGDPSTLACWQSILHDTTTLRLQTYTEESLGMWPDPNGFSYINHSVGLVSLRASSLFVEALCMPAPSLSSLEIIIPRRTVFWERMENHIAPVLSDDTLGGTPALLRSCHLSGLRLRSVMAPLTTLTSFDYQPDPNFVSPWFIISTLRKMPCLETLGICLRLQDPEAIAPVMSVLPRAWHQCLNRVALVASGSSWTDRDPEDFVKLVTLFRHVCANPHVTTAVDLRDSGPHFTSERLRWPRRLVEHPVEIDATYELTIFRDERLMVLGCHRTFARDWVTAGTTTFSTLVRLVIGELRWPEIAALSGNIPRLVSLSIILRTSHARPMAPYLSREEPNLFMSAALQPALDCPSLQHVELAGDAERGRYWGLQCVLSLTDVCQFVQTGLRFTSPRLRTLVLSGVSATTDPDPVAAFIAFQQLADDVSVREETSHDIRRLNALGEDCHFGRAWAPSHIFAPEEVANSRASDRFHGLGAS
ncbi:hypothetical protein EXIGLDRAFT_720796 [Exidia glandulosa HHB12029]|uniref:F-box domain-containing protein n=1 Tax=Exidia glandulosa HHB12029 TaxID=1314781 RepID=A0A165G4L1_EXIGL|nr:hypothetical protein EXIGLDRAFT_720796 [Exidia glandulosa HHB12029]